MRLRVKAVFGLFLVSLFVVFTFSGCGSSGSSAGDGTKLVSMEGVSGDYTKQALYTYDGQGRLTNLYTKIDGITNFKVPAAVSYGIALEYMLEYDSDGNITQIQIRNDFFTDGVKTGSESEGQYNYTYTDNKLTEFIYSSLNDDVLVGKKKMTYEYNNDGDLETIAVYENSPTKAVPDNNIEIITLTYDANKNVIQIEDQLLNGPTPGHTYRMAYNLNNQMTGHAAYYDRLAADIDRRPADETYELVYDDAVNTVDVTMTGDIVTTRYGFSPMDIGYRRFATDLGTFLAPTELVQLLSVSDDISALFEPAALLSAKQLITGEVEIDDVTLIETVYSGTTLDGNGYPQAMTLYDEIIGDSLDIDFTWE